MLQFPYITAVLTAIMAIFITVLAGLIIRKRFRYRVSLGVGSEDALERTVRAHGNCVEYAPFVIVTLGLAEAGGAAPMIIGVLAALFALARFSHAFGLHFGSGVNLFRTFGMIGTFTTMLVGAGLLVELALRHL